MFPKPALARSLAVLSAVFNICMHPQIYVVPMVVWKTHFALIVSLGNQTSLPGSRNRLASIRRHHCIAGLVSPLVSTGETAERSSGPTVNSQDFTEMIWSGTGREPRQWGHRAQLWGSNHTGPVDHRGLGG